MPTDTAVPGSTSLFTFSTNTVCPGSLNLFIPSKDYAHSSVKLQVCLSWGYFHPKAHFPRAMSLPVDCAHQASISAADVGVFYEHNVQLLKPTQQLSAYHHNTALPCESRWTPVMTKNISMSRYFGLIKRKWELQS